MERARLTEGIPRSPASGFLRRLQAISTIGTTRRGYLGVPLTPIACEGLHGRSPRVDRSTSSATVWDFSRSPEPENALLTTQPAKQRDRTEPVEGKKTNCLAGCVVNKAFSGSGERLKSHTVAEDVERSTRAERP